MITTSDPIEAVRAWFERINFNCPRLDFDDTEDIFADDVVGFGSKSAFLVGLKNLRANQWEKLWPTIRDYKIDLESMHAGGDKCFAWGVAVWDSTGFHEDGTTYSRPGRVTLILERRDHRWVAVHTHFSVNPGTPAFSYGVDPRMESTDS